MEKSFWNLILAPDIICNALIAAVLAGTVFVIFMLPFSKKSETSEEKVRERNFMAGAMAAILVMILSAGYFFWRLWEFFL